MNFDLTTWTGIGAATLVVVSTLKLVTPKLVGGREEIVSILAGLILGIAALSTHTMTFLPGWHGWAQAIVGGITAGLAAGVAHDKGLNPIKVAIFGSKDEGAGTSSGATGTQNTTVGENTPGANEKKG